MSDSTSGLEHELTYLKSELSKKEIEVGKLEEKLRQKSFTDRGFTTDPQKSPFSKVMLRVLKKDEGIIGTIKSFYLKGFSFWNYAFVCGLGLITNMIAFSVYIGPLGPALANFLAILTAWISNWTFSVGPLGWVFGLSPKTKKSNSPAKEKAKEKRETLKPKKRIPKKPRIKFEIPPSLKMILLGGLMLFSSQFVGNMMGGLLQGGLAIGGLVIIITSIDKLRRKKGVSKASK